MLSNLDDTSFIPISLAYAEETDDILGQNYALKSWLERFRFDHEHLYKSSLPSLSKNYLKFSKRKKGWKSYFYWQLCHQLERF